MLRRSKVVVARRRSISVNGNAASVIFRRLTRFALLPLYGRHSLPVRHTGHTIAPEGTEEVRRRSRFEDSTVPGLYPGQFYPKRIHATVHAPTRRHRDHVSMFPRDVATLHLPLACDVLARRLFRFRSFYLFSVEIWNASLRNLFDFDWNALRSMRSIEFGIWIFSNNCS